MIPQFVDKAWRTSKDMITPVKVLGKLLWISSPWLLIFFGMVKLLSAFVPVFQLVVIKYLIDGMVQFQETTNNQIYMWIGIFVLLMLVDSMTSSLGEWCKQSLAEKSKTLINIELLEAIDKEATLKFYEYPSYRSSLETLRDSTGWLPLQLINFTANSLSHLISVIGIFVVIANLSIILALAITISYIPFIYKYNQFKQLDWDEQYQLSPLRRRINYFKQLVLSVTTVKEVKLFQNGEYFEQQYLTAFRELFQKVYHIQKQGAISTAMTGLLAAILTGGGYLWIVYRAGIGTLSAGDIALFLTGVFQLSHYLRETSIESVFSFDVWRMGSDFTKFISDPVSGEAPYAASTKIEEEPMAIDFEQVSFSYPTYEKSIIENISFSIKPGEKIAIVGENGSGKTTLVKLICGFYRPTNGIVKLNGEEMQLTKEERDNISVVFQDFGKYAFDIKTNVALGYDGENPDNEKVEKAITFAGLQQDMKQLPKGLDTLLGREWDGVELSGGQWQKLAISRSHYKPSGILILDEPTASLDILSEYGIYSRFSEYTHNKTTIIISHRFSTVKMADRILVLKHGKIIESGSHIELLNHNGEYAHMYQLQASLFRNQKE